MKDLQIGSKKGSRTSDHLFVLKTLVDKYTCKNVENTGRKLQAYVCFVDFRKAFYSVWRNALLLKLLYSEVGNKFDTLLKSMYSSVRTCIKIKNKITPFFSLILVSANQGDNLSPSLFIFFINDISDIFDMNDHPTKLGKRSIN